MTKPIPAFAVLLLSSVLCFAQDKSQSTQDYERQLVALMSALQKNPWLGWAAGTEVTIRYLVDRDAAGKPLSKERPDVIFRVIEASQRFDMIQDLKGKSWKREFLIKDQIGLDVARPKLTDPTSVEFEIDGFKLPGLFTESTLREFPRGTWTTTEWTLASHPSIVVRQELNGYGWKVSSARVFKTVGGREFSCVEIKERTLFYHQGPALAATTQYLCPDVPGHLVEEIQHFFRIKKGKEETRPFQVVHQKVVEIKLPQPRG